MGVMRHRHGRARRTLPPRASARSGTRPGATGAPSGVPRFLRAGASEWASRLDRPACCEHLDEATTWAGHSGYGPQDIIGAGGRGGFTAWYFPFGGNGVLHVVESVAADLKDALVETAGVITPHADLPVTPGMTALAARIDAIPEPDRTIALSAHRWSGGAEETRWLADLESNVQDAWGFEHSFFLNQPCWQFIGADVNVDVQLHRGAKTSSDHMALEVYKFPAGGDGLRDFGVPREVSHGSGTDTRDQSMRLDSTNTGVRPHSLLDGSVTFDLDSADLTPAARTALRAFIARYNGATAHAAFSRARIDVVGRASSSGSDAHNLQLSEQRAERVRDFLAANGLVDVPIRVTLDPQGERAANQAHDEPADRRVELRVDGAQHMNSGTHEFGHAFGLGDEYVVPGKPIGSDAAHHPMVTRMTDANGRHLPGAAVEHTGGIMSFGNEVRPQHYATFHHALETITAKSPWSLGTHADLADIQGVCSGAGMPPCEGDTCVASAPTADMPPGAMIG